MKRTLCILFQIIFIYTAFGQQWGIKSYAGFTTGQEPNFFVFDTVTTMFNAPRTTSVKNRAAYGPFAAFAISRTGKGKVAFYELGFKFMNIKSTDDVIINYNSGVTENAGEVQFTHVSVPFECNFHLSKNSKRWKTFWGITAVTEYNRSKFAPRYAYYAPKLSRDYFLNFGIVPRVQYQLSGHWMIDLNAPLTFFKCGIEYFQLENASFAKYGGSSNTAFDLKRGLSIKAGVAYLFKSPKSDNAPTKL